MVLCSKCPRTLFLFIPPSGHRGGYCDAPPRSFFFLSNFKSMVSRQPLYISPPGSASAAENHQGSPHPMTDQCRGIKVWPYPPSSGQLCRAILTPALPVGSAKSVTSLASKLNFSLFPVLLSSPPLHRC